MSAFDALTSSGLAQVIVWSCATIGVLLAPFSAHALERFTVLFLVHEASGIPITLRPVLVMRIEYLRAVTNGAATGVVPAACRT